MLKEDENSDTASFAALLHWVSVSDSYCFVFAKKASYQKCTPMHTILIDRHLVIQAEL